MPNHVHALIDFASSTKKINTVIGDGKRFMAYEIIKRLEQQGANDILKRLQEAVNSSDKKKAKLHEL